MKAILVRDRYQFRVGLAGDDWNRALLLNLGFWQPKDGGDVLIGERIPADVVAHVGWHHLASRALGSASATAVGMFLGESIASAFDLYLVGKFLVDAPRANFLTTQVPAMAEVAESAGLSATGFARLLEQMAAAPEDAFSELRALLFAVSTQLVRARGPEAAAAVLARHEKHRFFPLLHHYNLANWVLFARAHGAAGDSRRVLQIDRALRRGDALGWLTEHWLGPAE